MHTHSACCHCGMRMASPPGAIRPCNRAAASALLQSVCRQLRCMHAAVHLHTPGKALKHATHATAGPRLSCPCTSILCSWSCAYRMVHCTCIRGPLKLAHKLRPPPSIARKWEGHCRQCACTARCKRRKNKRGQKNNLLQVALYACQAGASHHKQPRKRQCNPAISHHQE